MFRLLSAAVFAISLACVAVPSAAVVHVYGASLDGASESPPNVSPGTGSTQVEYDDVLHTLRVYTTFSGLIGTTTNSHIHGPTAVAGTGTANVITPLPSFPGFPSGVTNGLYDQTLDLTLASSWNAAYVTANGGTTAGAEAALAAALAAGKTYLNIHTSAFSGGEIRGFLTPVPEPATLGLVAAGALMMLRRRRGS